MSNEKYQTAKAKLLADLAVSRDVYQKAKDAATEKYKELVMAADAVNTETIAVSEQKYSNIMSSANAKLREAGNTPAAFKQYRITQTEAYAVLCKETNDSIFRRHEVTKPHHDALQAAEDANEIAWTAAHDAFYANSSDPDFIRGQAAAHAAEDDLFDIMESSMDFGRRFEYRSHDF